METFLNLFVPFHCCKRVVWWLLYAVVKQRKLFHGWRWRRKHCSRRGCETAQEILKKRKRKTFCSYIVQFDGKLVIAILHLLIKIDRKHIKAALFLNKKQSKRKTLRELT